MLARLKLLQHDGKLVFGDGEDNADRLELGDHQQSIRVRRVDDVARVDEAQSDAAGDRRGDAAVSEVELYRINQALIGLDDTFILIDQRFLSGELLLGNGVLLE